MSKVLEVKGYTAEEIKAFIKSEDKYKIGIRLYAVYQVAKGNSSRKLEDLYQTSFKQITNWVHRFEKEGVEGLRDKPGRGRKSRLNEDQLKSLSHLIKHANPSDYGYNTSTWNGVLLMDWIKVNFGVEYKKTQIYNLLKQMGFSYQKSRGSYPESDKVKQETFKEELKKKRC
jgi:transposase